MNKNYVYYMGADVSKYAGEWIAICNRKVVSTGKNVKDVFEDAKKKCPKERPFLTKVPTEETMLF